MIERLRLLFGSDFLLDMQTNCNRYRIPAFPSADASLTRLSRICAGVQAAKPNTNAGFSFASMEKNESVDGLTPISVVIRLIIGKSSPHFNQATMFNPDSGTCKVKRSPSNLLKCSMKKSRRSEYIFRIRLM